MGVCESERVTFEPRHENKSCSACRERVNERVSERVSVRKSEIVRERVRECESEF